MEWLEEKWLRLLENVIKTQDIVFDALSFCLNL